MENNKNSREPYQPPKRSFKEQRIRSITLAYYSSPEIRKTIFNFSQNRECIPRYYEGFGKRPDTFQYESDILEQVKKGATSFHCSEELWSDPLEISNELSEQEFNELRIGWDLLLDVDSPYLEYSKIYTKLLIDVLKFHRVENVGVKFSGSKGFHVIIPWKAFPEEIYNQKTKDMFPEWPRLICQYLSATIQPKLAEEILQDENLKQIAKKTEKTEKELIVRGCIKCKRPAEKKFLITWTCPYCKNEIINMEGSFNNRRKSRCPDCRNPLSEISRKEIYACNFCNTNSERNPEKFEKKERFATEKLIEADLILVAPRHLFRMPYSLHEKTALASIVIDKDKIKDFQITDAKLFKSEIKDFYPNAKPREAKELILQALDWKEQKDKYPKPSESKINNLQTSSNKKDYKQIKITNLTDDLLPPCIKLILKGVKQDGRKRALFILINFFKSLGFNEQELENKINEWNEKNYKSLKQGYIKSQLHWHNKQEARLPPNCDKPHYKDLAVCYPDELCRQIKNPVNYIVKKFFKKNK